MYNCRNTKKCCYKCKNNCDYLYNSENNANIISNDFIVNSDDCDCGFKKDSLFPENPMLAQSYVPIQYMKDTFCPMEGLKHGSIFPELVNPYKPRSIYRRNCIYQSNE